MIAAMIFRAMLIKQAYKESGRSDWLADAGVRLDVETVVLMFSTRIACRDSRYGDVGPVVREQPPLAGAVSLQ
jgi:hypothetical protein